MKRARSPEASEANEEASLAPTSKKQRILPAQEIVTPTTFGGLPNELLLLIFSFAENNQIGSLLRVSKAINKLISESEDLWLGRYNTEFSKNYVFMNAAFFEGANDLAQTYLYREIISFCRDYDSDISSGKNEIKFPGKWSKKCKLVKAADAQKAEMLRKRYNSAIEAYNARLQPGMKAQQTLATYLDFVRHSLIKRLQMRELLCEEIPKLKEFRVSGESKSGEGAESKPEGGEDDEEKEEKEEEAKEEEKEDDDNGEEKKEGEEKEEEKEVDDDAKQTENEEKEEEEEKNSDEEKEDNEDNKEPSEDKKETGEAGGEDEEKDDEEGDYIWTKDELDDIEAMKKEDKELLEGKRKKPNFPYELYAGTYGSSEKDGDEDDYDGENDLYVNWSEKQIGLAKQHPNDAKLVKAYFIADTPYDKMENSWIELNGMDLEFQAFPNLLHFRSRGSQCNLANPLLLENLMSITLITGGLNNMLVKNLMASHLPNLHHLELWLGTDNYGGNYEVSDFDNLFTKEETGIFPKLQYLGLRNAEKIDQLCEPLVHSAIAKRIRILDLSLGTLSEKGATHLLHLQTLHEADPIALEILDCHRHFIEKKELVKKMEQMSFLVNLTSFQDEDPDSRYVAVGE